jgi:hypothetical protein
MKMINKVVVQYKNKQIKKGETGDFMPNKSIFHLHLSDGGKEQIIIEDLKAIFFVKDLSGNKEYNEQYDQNIPGGGKKLQIEFSDGEILVGFSQTYSPTRASFFIIPADKESNNDRIFIVKSATKNVLTV